MSKVYITQESRFDFRGAEEYGEIVFLSQDRRDDFYNIANSGHNKRLLAHLAFGLREFDQDNDWLVLAGSPYVSMAVFWLLGRKGVSRVNILRWDNRDLMYIPLTLTVETKDEQSQAEGDSAATGRGRG